jgi:uncharacterized protein (DUF983 family)
MFIKKETKLYSIVHLKCPKCHEGDLFLESNAWNFKTMLDMPDKCKTCGQDFRIEPGFYTGALWVNYPLVIVSALILMIPTVFYPDFLILNLSIMVLVMLSLQPIFMRYGRAMWINIFVHYKPC